MAKYKDKCGEEKEDWVMREGMEEVLPNLDEIGETGGIELSTKALPSSWA